MLVPDRWGVGGVFSVKVWRCQVELERHIRGAESRQTAPVSGAAGGWLVEVDKGQVMRGPETTVRNLFSALLAIKGHSVLSIRP